MEADARDSHGLDDELLDHPIRRGDTGIRLLLTLLSLSLLYIAASGAVLFVTRPRRSTT